MKIFDNIRILQIAIVSGLLFFLASIIVLYREYSAIKKHIHELVLVREEYQNYVIALKRIISDYQKNSSALSTLDESSSEKKKMNEDKSDFLLLNRDGEYLKKSALSYARLHNLHDAVEKLYWSDDFVAKSRKMGAKKQYIKRRSQRKVARKSSNLDQDAPAWWETIKREPIFSFPITKGDFWVSSRFGPRKKEDGSLGFHHGLDMAAVRGTPVRAAGSGVVIEAGVSRGYGNTVVISHNRKFKTRYAHLEKITTRRGAKVDSSTIIGRVGDTGSVRKRGNDGSHLHFEIYVFDKRVNPLYFLA